jgi:hypothetical protein
MVSTNLQFSRLTKRAIIAEPNEEIDEAWEKRSRGAAQARRGGSSGGPVPI